MAQQSKDNYKSQASQLFNFSRDSYLDRTSRPIYSLTYLLGFIILYEIGTVLVSPEVLSQSLAEARIRVVAFVWVQNFIEWLGFSSNISWFAAPLVVVIILLALQITSKTSWRVSVKDFLPMTLECIALAFPLIVLGILINSSSVSNEMAVLGGGSDAVTLSTVVSGSPTDMFMIDVVTGLGAGIYEELIFRLVMISLISMCLHDFLGVDRKWSAVVSVVFSAILFSAYHHILFVNGSFQIIDEFSRSKFIFRFLAGGYFAAIYAARGFGTVAGTHAFYDILAAIFNAFVFVEHP